MIEEPAPITEASLLGELEILRQEIAITEQQLERLRAEREAAIIAEDEAGQALRAAEQVFVPLLESTRQGDAKIHAIGDTWWRQSFPQAAQAHDQVRGCQEVCQKASARTDGLHRAVLDAEKRRLPALRTAARDKEAELDAFRAAQLQAVEQRETRLQAGLDKFRARLRGGKP